MERTKIVSGKKIYRWLFLIAFLLLVIWFGTTRAEAATPYKSNGKLSIKDGQVVNSKGKAFLIKGVSTHGIAWYPEYVNKAAFKTLRDDWGVNTIRLSLYTAEYNGYCTGGNKKQLEKTIDDGVKYATDLGMYVIIDWHILSDGNPLTYKSKANTFFKKIAKKYAKKGNVMYEICNEPNGSGGSWKNIKSYSKKIIKTIRSVNKNAIIIVGTPTWSQDVDKALDDPITGYKNIAYSFHFYAGTHQADMRTKLENVLKKKLPVIVTEFGISEASGNGKANTSQGDAWMKLLDKYKVGRVCWNLSNKNETSALIKSSCKKKSGWTTSNLTASGKWLVKAYKGKLATTKTTSKSSTSSKSKTTSKSKATSTTKTTTKSKSTTKRSATSQGDVKVNATLQKVNSWKSGGKYYTQYKLILKNTGNKTSSQWTVSAKFGRKVQLSDKWCATFSKSGKKLTMKPLSWNQQLGENQTTEIGFVLKSSKIQSIKSISVSAN